MEKSYLLVSDFDGTIADTFQKSPKGIGVNEAYELAIIDIFGEIGLDIFKEIGGLQNRAPGEITSLIFDFGNEESLFKLAESCFDRKSKTLRRLVPDGKGAPLEWVEEDRFRLRKTVTEMLVLIKLAYLIDEVGSEFSGGQIWPRPCNGFLEFYRLIDELKDSGIDIQVAIISSGHDEFIKKTFLVWELVPPRIFVTDDDTRAREYPEKIERRMKPSSFLFDIIQSCWISEKAMLFDSARLIELIIGTRKRMLLIGDDLIKDRGLARNAGVPFGLFDQLQKGITKTEDYHFSFGDWSDVAKFFLQGSIKKLFKEGKPFTKIIQLIR